METSKVIDILQRFDNWVNQHKEFVVATLDFGGYGDKELVTLERGYLISHIDIYNNHNEFEDYFVTLTIKVKEIGDTYIPNIRFQYFPNSNKLTYNMDGIQGEWFV